MTVAEFARLVGVQKSAVSKWVGGFGPSPKSTLLIEERAGIPRHELRPDLWPTPVNLAEAN